MWIMLTCKLPTRPSPPKLGIFWSVPWPDGKISARQANQCVICDAPIRHYKDGDYCDCADGEPVRYDSRTHTGFDHFGYVSNWVGARAIHFAGQTLRVFPNEFSVVSPENMHVYVLGQGVEAPSHELVAEGTASERALNQALESDQRMVYDAALVDGATHAQALAVALEMEITVDDSPPPEFPPLGWYRCHPDYATYFCHDWEMIEDRTIVMEPEAI